MLKAILFDCDGVIAETEIGRFLHYKKIVEDRGYKCMEEKKHFRLCIGRTGEDFLQKVFGKKMSEQEIREIARKRRNEFKYFVKEFAKEMKGVKTTTRKLSKRYVLVVVSGSKRRVVEAILKHLGIKEYFKLLVTGNDVKNRKPHPEAYLKVLKKLKLKADECLTIEDSAIGIKSAKKAGIMVIGKRNKIYEEFGYKADLPKADFIIDELEEIINIIKDIQNAHRR